MLFHIARFIKFCAVLSLIQFLANGCPCYAFESVSDENFSLNEISPDTDIVKPSISETATSQSTVLIWFLENWFSVFTFIVGISVSWLFGVLSLRPREKQLRYSIDNSRLVSQHVENHPELSIKFKGYGEAFETVSVAHIFVWGKTYIDKKDISNNTPLKIEMKGTAKVLSCPIVYSTDGVEKVEVTRTNERDSARIQFDYINRDEGFIVELLHTGDSTSSLDLSGKVKNGQLINSTALKPSKLTRWTLLIVILVTILILSVTAGKYAYDIVVQVSQWAELNLSSLTILYWTIILMIIFLGLIFNLMMSPLIIFMDSYCAPVKLREFGHIRLGSQNK